MSHLGTFADRVKAARETMFARTGRTMRQADLGKAVGLSGAAVSTWETGDSVPPTESIPLIASVLVVDPAWLAWGEGQNPFQSAQNAPRGAGSGDASVVAVPRGKPLKGKRRAG